MTLDFIAAITVEAKTLACRQPVPLFGADDLDGVPASDDAPDGRRRAPIEEIRRNIEAAGFSPAERDGLFNPVG